MYRALTIFKKNGKGREGKKEKERKTQKENSILINAPQRVKKCIILMFLIESDLSVIFQLRKKRISMAKCYSTSTVLLFR